MLFRKFKMHVKPSRSMNLVTNLQEKTVEADAGKNGYSTQNGGEKQQPSTRWSTTPTIHNL